MIPAAFDYLAPSSLDEAVGLLQEFGDEAKLLAGGHSLIPLMKLRLAQPSRVIDLNRIPGLEYIREEAGVLQIGALTRYADLAASPLLRSRCAALADAAGHIADPLVRNWGTIGGNCAHGDPANDLPAVMLALDARFLLRGPGGERTVAADGFYLDTFVTALEPSEILTEIQIPAPAPGTGSAYEKLERRVGDFPIAGAAARVTLDAAGRISAAGLALTNVGPTAIKAREAEASLIGERPDEAALAEAGRLAAAAAEPVSDLRGPAEYKRNVVRVLLVRALRRAVARAQGVAS